MYLFVTPKKAHFSTRALLSAHLFKIAVHTSQGPLRTMLSSGIRHPHDRLKPMIPCVSQSLCRLTTSHLLRKLPGNVRSRRRICRSCKNPDPAGRADRIALVSCQSMSITVRAPENTWIAPPWQLISVTWISPKHDPDTGFKPVLTTYSTSDSSTPQSARSSAIGARLAPSR